MVVAHLHRPQRRPVFRALHAELLGEPVEVSPGITEKNHSFQSCSGIQSLRMSIGT